MPFILCKSCCVFLRLKKGFQGGNLGNSLDGDQQRKMHSEKLLQAKSMEMYDMNLQHQHTS